MSFLTKPQMTTVDPLNESLRPLRDVLAQLGVQQAQQQMPSNTPFAQAPSAWDQLYHSSYSQSHLGAQTTPDSLFTSAGLGLLALRMMGVDPGWIFSNLGQGAYNTGKLNPMGGGAGGGSEGGGGGGSESQGSAAPSDTTRANVPGEGGATIGKPPAVAAAPGSLDEIIAKYNSGGYPSEFWAQKDVDRLTGRSDDWANLAKFYQGIGDTQAARNSVQMYGVNGPTGGTSLDAERAAWKALFGMSDAEIDKMMGSQGGQRFDTTPLIKPAEPIVSGSRYMASMNGEINPPGVTRQPWEVL